MKMQKILCLIFCSAFLSACANSPMVKNSPKNPPQLPVPKSLTHNGKPYFLASKQDLGTLARYVYLEKKENLKNWKSSVELLLDRNAENRTLADRIALRERVYKNTGIEQFHLSQENNKLYEFVIYPPTQQHPNWQIEVAKGEDIADCGFVQYSYSMKINKSAKLANMDKVKLISYLRKFAIDRELAQLKQLKYHWQCRSDNNQN